KKRFTNDYKLSKYDAGIMASDKKMADYFEKGVSLYNKPKEIANWLMGNISAYMKEKNLAIDTLNLKIEHLTGMLKMIDNNIISGKTAKTLLIDMISSGKDPKTLVKEKGLEQITDDGAIEKAIKEVISENPNTVSDFKSGKQNAVMFLVGKVMAKTKGKANPKKVIELLKKHLI
ncbi:MAG: Asp-tRNA(Asn)/Glu-tRNA(Gln) amidotransferase GatCAB subunit B, partial [Candidatus Omnitrophota bacterium]|nr:Asp-tRNA(Asn)/Glu-tRNA(Gln) amidotransferase GatCAB subunit B [Candidatus Omnitrophota bacterium]